MKKIRVLKKKGSPKETQKDSFNLDEVTSWALQPNVDYSMASKEKKTKDQKIKAKKLEKEWGNRMIKSLKNTDQTTNQWTTMLGEILVKKVLESKGKKVWRPKPRAGCKPDWETNDEVIEVKTRNWTTPGTAGEKVLGTPFKYSEVAEAYGKPLKIILIAYQEWELTYGQKNMRIFGENVSENKKKILQTFREMKVEYLPFTELLSI